MHNLRERERERERERDCLVYSCVSVKQCKVPIELGFYWVNTLEAL